jgi:hypothetical protein
MCSVGVLVAAGVAFLSVCHSESSISCSGSSAPDSQGTSWDEYPIQINPDGRPLHELGIEGWRVVVNDDLGEALKNRSPKYVTVVGYFDDGKSWLVNTVSNANYPSDFSLPTEGVCVSAYESIVWMDIAGVGRPGSVSNLRETEAKDDFLQYLSMYAGDVVVYVTNSLTQERQRRLQDVISSMHQITGCNFASKAFYIVHNFHSMTNDAQVRAQIDKDIMIFGGQEERIPMYVEKENGIEKVEVSYFSTYEKCSGGGAQVQEVRHLIFAKQGSEAGKTWNMNSRELLLNLIRSSTGRAQSDADKSVNVVEKIRGVLEQMLPKYFLSTKQAQGDCDKGDSGYMESVACWFKKKWSAVTGSQELQQFSLFSMLSVRDVFPDGGVDPDFQTVLEEKKDDPSQKVLKLKIERALDYTQSDMFTPMIDWGMTETHHIIEIEVPGFRFNDSVNELHCEAKSATLMHVYGMRTPTQCYDDVCAEKSQTSAIQNSFFSQRQYGFFRVGIEAPPGMGVQSIVDLCTSENLKDGVLTLKFLTPK